MNRILSCLIILFLVQIIHSSEYIVFYSNTGEVKVKGYIDPEKYSNDPNFIVCQSSDSQIIKEEIKFIKYDAQERKPILKSDLEKQTIIKNDRKNNIISEVSILQDQLKKADECANNGFEVSFSTPQIKSKIITLKDEYNSIKEVQIEP